MNGSCGFKSETCVRASAAPLIAAASSPPQPGRCLAATQQTRQVRLRRGAPVVLSTATSRSDLCPRRALETSASALDGARDPGVQGSPPFIGPPPAPLGSRVRTRDSQPVAHRGRVFSTEVLCGLNLPHAEHGLSRTRSRECDAVASQAGSVSRDRRQRAAAPTRRDSAKRLRTSCVAARPDHPRAPQAARSRAARDSGGLSPGAPHPQRVGERPADAHHLGDRIRRRGGDRGRRYPRRRVLIEARLMENARMARSSAIAQVPGARRGAADAVASRPSLPVRASNVV